MLHDQRALAVIEFQPPDCINEVNLLLIPRYSLHSSYFEIHSNDMPQKSRKDPSTAELAGHSSRWAEIGCRNFLETDLTELIKLKSPDHSRRYCPCEQYRILRADLADKKLLRACERPPNMIHRLFFEFAFIRTEPDYFGCLGIIFTETFSVVLRI